MEVMYSSSFGNPYFFNRFFRPESFQRLMTVATFLFSGLIPNTFINCMLILFKGIAINGRLTA
ncbi:hypothetical protein BD770DRAFT_382347 [Pilaira anomala]|nr:hypothetical protein BD770DRAFT_382347 [Pilaira anomala]